MTRHLGSAVGLEFRLLGPLEVLRDGVVVPIPAAMQRSLLACLLLEANRPVPVGTLAARLWPVDPPQDVRATLRSYVMRLRRALGHDRIETRDPGFLIHAHEDEVDLLRFRRAASRAHAESDERANRCWRDALAEWRGDALANVPCDALHREYVPDLVEQRLLALECRIDGDLRLGRHAEVVAELGEVVRAHPLRERFWAQLMLAQYRSSRQADALDTYQRVRALLAAELGVEPSAELRELHRAVLAGDVAPAPTSAAIPVPAHLPADVSAFTGRTDVLAELDHVAESAEGRVAIAVLSGSAGVGKTALAVHWAHRNRERFPDGQLVVDLCGYGPQEPVEPADALAWMLRSLGAPVPPSTAERAALFRSLMAQRRALVLLDNACGADQVRPLLPGSATCTVLITSRDDLAGLVAREGARRVEVPRMPLADARALLGALVGSRAEDDPASTDELAEQCARLPLALRVVAESAASRPATALADLARSLRDRDRRTQVLRAGDDGPSSIYTVFSWSLDRLSPAAARVFRLLGCYPGRTFDELLLAALAGTDATSGADLAEVLARAHLVERADERFRMHDLLREYAADRARHDLPTAERDEALDRVTAYHRAALSAAVDVIAPFERHYRPAPGPSTTPLPTFGDPVAAHRWLDRERQNLIATAEHGPDHHTIHVALVLWRSLNAGGYNDEGARLCDLAIAAARRSGDQVAELHARANRAIAEVHLGRSAGLVEELLQALETAALVGDKLAESRLLNSIAVVTAHEGDYERSMSYDAAALELAREAGDRYGEYRTLINLGSTYHRVDDVVRARELSEQGLALALQDGNASAASRALNNLGYQDIRSGELTTAIDYLNRAMELTGRAGDRATRGYVLGNLGTAYLRGDDPHRASIAFREARDLAVAAADVQLLSSCYLGLGELAELTGQRELALDQYRRALDLARSSGYSFQAHRMHGVLTRAYLDAGDDARAEHHRREAERLERELGLPRR